MRRLRVALLALALAATLGAVPAGAQADRGGQAPGVTLPRNDDNPLAGRKWGVYKGRADQAWLPYVRATGHRKKLLAKIALRPKAKWYGAWIPDRDIEAKIRELQAMRQTLKALVHACHGDARPDCPILEDLAGE